MEGVLIFLGGVIVGSLITGTFFNQLLSEKKEELRIIKGQLTGQHHCW